MPAPRSPPPGYVRRSPPRIAAAAAIGDGPPRPDHVGRAGPPLAPTPPARPPHPQPRRCTAPRARGRDGAEAAGGVWDAARGAVGGGGGGGGGVARGGGPRRGGGRLGLGGGPSGTVYFPCRCCTVRCSTILSSLSLSPSLSRSPPPPERRARGRQAPPGSPCCVTGRPWRALPPRARLSKILAVPRTGRRKR